MGSVGSPEAQQNALIHRFDRKRPSLSLAVTDARGSVIWIAVRRVQKRRTAARATRVRLMRQLDCYRSPIASSRPEKSTPAGAGISLDNAMLWTRFVLRFVPCRDRSILSNSAIRLAMRRRSSTGRSPYSIKRTLTKKYHCKNIRLRPKKTGVPVWYEKPGGAMGLCHGPWPPPAAG